MNIKKILAIFVTLFSLVCAHITKANQPISQILQVELPPQSWMIILTSGQNLLVSQDSCGVYCKDVKVTLLSGTHGKLNFKLVDLAKFFLSTQNIEIPFEVENNKLTTPTTSYRMSWKGESVLDSIADVSPSASGDIYFMAVHDEYQIKK